MFQCFVFFLIFAFSCLHFSSLALLLDISKPKRGPPNEVYRLDDYIYIYIDIYLSFLPPLFFFS